MTTLTEVPAAPAPGETTETAGAGFVAVAEPVRPATSADPPGAEFGMVSEPVRVVLGRTELGVKLTKIVHEEFAAIEPVGQLLLAV